MVFVYLSLTTATPLTTLLVRPLETFYLRLVEWLKLEPVTPKGRVFKSLLIDIYSAKKVKKWKCSSA